MGLTPNGRFWFFVVYGILNVVALATVGYIFGAKSQEEAFALVISVGIAPFVRMITSGSWNPPNTITGVALIVGALSLSGCASVERVGVATMQCTAESMAKRVEIIIPILISDMANPDWQSVLDQRWGAMGDVVVCAAKAIAAELVMHEAKGIGPIGGFRYTEAESRQASEWLKKRGL